MQSPPLHARLSTDIDPSRSALSHARGADTTLIAYDPDEHRALLKARDGSTVTYAGGLYEKRTTPDGSTDTHVFYVHDGGRVIAQVPWERTGGVLLKQAPTYFYDDHLGSVETISGPNGVQSFKYDPFGRRIDVRNPTRDGGVANGVRKGFTAHEHDEALGLVNMQGRMYDPRAGRFLSPDPYVTSPYDGQSLNRYSYVNNDPLNWVDPSGFEEQGGGGTYLGNLGGDETFGIERVGGTVTQAPTGDGANGPAGGIESSSGGWNSGMTSHGPTGGPSGPGFTSTADGGGPGTNRQVSDDSGTHSAPVSFLLGVGFGVRRTGAGPAAPLVHPPSDADAAFHYGEAVGEAVTSTIAILLGAAEAGVGGAEAVVASPTGVGAVPGLAAVAGGAALAGYGELGLVQAAQALQTARAAGEG